MLRHIVSKIIHSIFIFAAKDALLAQIGPFILKFCGKLHSETSLIQQTTIVACTVFLRL